ncbi:MAG: preprotein translocase subunit YajC [Victivallales bacterium]|nr:preprotein translocase subunit YajC [Victivallales bacterium]
MGMILLNGMSVLAMAGGQGGAQGGGMWDMLLMMAVIMGLMYFMVMRPQQRREKERQAMLKRITVGDKVRTIGGILGTVAAVSETTITVTVADKVAIDFVRDAVQLVEGEPAKDVKKEDDANKK